MKKLSLRKLKNFAHESNNDLFSEPGLIYYDFHKLYEFCTNSKLKK